MIILSLYMTKIERFNLGRYKELLQLKQDGKMSMPDENYLELGGLKSNVNAHVVYNRKEVYCSLIEDYLNKCITPSNFRSKCVEMLKEDSKISYQILQDFQQLEVLSLSKNRHQFHEPIDEIAHLCMIYNGDTPESDCYSWVKSEFLKIPKNLSK